MSDGLERNAVIVALVFCRIGGCMLLLPGFSGPRVPMQLRLFIAIAVSLSVAPLVAPSVKLRVPDFSPVGLLDTMFLETAIGVAFGLMIRLFLLALQFSSTMISSLMGFATPPQPSVHDDELSTPFADFILLATITLMFSLGLHLSLFEALIDTYIALPVGGGMEPGEALRQILRATSAAFALTIRLSAPFIVYSLLVNALLAVANRWVPQIPIQLISAPAVLAGGLLVAYFTIPFLVDSFLDSFSAWLKAL